ncbi:hypothetical protein [Frigidibacter sp. ROC022]|uniref:hypothetical protein n=1 Tax=Frigidibacter sp. ROC022 TaxID=2971796 RepID=UPI00215A6AF5|nr:hypothetical protein [Frigidibacter sp. ROC022]MCR8725656.1 hypothetical protein [Frigidibacter sp. ROC022]
MSPEAAAAQPRRRLALAIMLVAVILLELAARLTGQHQVQTLAWLAMAGVVVLNLRGLGMREIYLLTLCSALAVLILIRMPEPMLELGPALDQASFLMTFILLMSLLFETAARSPSIAACGVYLTSQPPGRRYYALNAGTGILAVMFNLGVVSFLVPLIQRGIASATPGDALNDIRERRQVSALLRGFAWSVTWSPTALAPLAVAELIPGVDRLLWIEYGLAVFVLIMVLGAFEDRWRFRRFRPSGVRRETPFPLTEALLFLAACAWLFGMIALIVWLSGDGVVFGLLLACPFMVVGWLAVQGGFPRPGWIAPLRGEMRKIVVVGLPRTASVAITLATSGFIGRAAAGQVPAEQLAAFLQLDAMPDFVFLSLIPPALSLFSLLALSPIMMAVFFGSLFAALPVLPADPTLIAFAISCGWALSMTFSPFATVVLMVERVAGIPTRRLTWVWNIGFTLLASLSLVGVFALLTGGT